MMMFLGILIAVEAVTEIIGEADVFAWLRNGLKRMPGIFGWYLGGLFGCRYCLSVWVSFAGAIVCPRMIPGDEWYWMVADFAVKAFTLHRLSNVLHEGVNRFLTKQPFLISLIPMETVPMKKVKDFLNDVMLGSTDKTIVARFYADWCGACKIFEPVFNEVAADAECETITFVSVDADKHDALCSELDIMGLPTTMIVRDGKIVKRTEGSMNKKQLIKWLTTVE